jgi:hypothetical protein
MGKEFLIPLRRGPSKILNNFSGSITSMEESGEPRDTGRTG